MTAFTAFTDELDLWWVRGPINAYDSGRLVEMRCEPGVGGRILEVYDADSGEGLELARITAWEPGRHVAWDSSLDDVSIDVRFESTGTGTVVRLRATVSEGGEDRGGSSFVAMTPAWFGAWIGRRDIASRELRDLARVALTLHYARPVAAARWLADVFGFESPNPLPDGTIRSRMTRTVFRGSNSTSGTARSWSSPLQIRLPISPTSRTYRGCSSTMSRRTSRALANAGRRSSRTSRGTGSRPTSRSTSNSAPGASRKPGQRSRIDRRRRSDSWV
jgi:hypothetical protein